MIRPWLNIDNSFENGHFKLFQIRGTERFACMTVSHMALTMAPDTMPFPRHSPSGMCPGATELVPATWRIRMGKYFPR